MSGEKTNSGDLFTAVMASEGLRFVREYRFHPTRRWRFDYCCPEHMIAVEVEGGVFTRGRHTRPLGFLGDITKYNTATLMGWRLFRVTPKTLVTNSTIDMIKSAAGI